MTEINSKIFDLLINGYTLNEIADIMNISIKQIHQRINIMKKQGYLLTHDISADGEIKYIQKLYLPETKTNTTNLTLTDNTFKAMLISDLHIGNEKQNINYLYDIYDLCVKEGIHIIINAGDIIDGPSSRGNQIITAPNKQIEFTIKNHPFDKNILNLICFGNHDYDALQKTGRCVKTAFEHMRPDFIGLGYGLGIINLGNDQIIVNHKITSLPFHPVTNKLVLCGHHHKMAFTEKEDSFLVNIPTLSDLCFNQKQKTPGAIIMKLTLDKNGIIKEGYFENLLINSKIFTISENNFLFNFPCETAKEENLKMPPKKKQLAVSSNMSQIEKFNMRYNR